MIAGGNAIRDGEQVTQKPRRHSIGKISKTFPTYLEILLKTLVSVLRNVKIKCILYRNSLPFFE